MVFDLLTPVFVGNARDDVVSEEAKVKAAVEGRTVVFVVMVHVRLASDTMATFALVEVGNV